MCPSDSVIAISNMVIIGDYLIKFSFLISLEYNSQGACWSV